MLLSTLQIISDRWNLEFRYCKRRSDLFLEESEYTESMGPDEMYPRVLREVPNVVAKPLFMVFENPWHAGEVLGNWKRENIAPIFRKCKKEDPRNYWPVSLSVPGKIMEQILLGAMLRHMKNRDVIWDSWHSFTMARSCLTNLVALCGQVTTTVDKERAKDVIYLDFHKAFDLVPCNLLLS